MADALCGPSNALQTFQKQASVDRTLQQDRLAARSQAESFRSSSRDTAGVLDAEFEAFQAGQPLEAVYSEPQFFANGAPTNPFQPNAQRPLPVSSNWASDFQNLYLDDAYQSPIPQSQFHQHAPLQRHQTPNWHEDFLRQQNQSASYQPQHQQRPANGWANGYNNGLVQHSNDMLSPTAKEKQSDRQAEEAYDEAAFEQAFEKAQSALHVEQDIQLDQDLYRTREAGQNLMDDNVHNHVPQTNLHSGHVVSGDEEQKAESKDEADADELARAAGQLLDNVKGDQSRKFQESNFLSLMRQLRDKEVRVEGDKLVDVSIPSSIPEVIHDQSVPDIRAIGQAALYLSENDSDALHRVIKQIHQPLHPGGRHYPNRSQQD